MWTNDYIKIPFKECGRDRNGADCWGLARIIYKERLNIDLPNLLEYNDTDDRSTIASLYGAESTKWISVPKGQETEYDIAVFRMLGFPTHIGIVYKTGRMIHCERGSGTYITDYNDSRQWFRRLVGFYRYAAGSDIPTPLQS